MEKNHPGLEKYGYIHRTLYYCDGLLALEEVAQQIKKTVPVDHPDLPILRGAYKLRRSEIREAALKKNAELKEQMNKQNGPLITLENNRDDSVRRFSKK